MRENKKSEGLFIRILGVAVSVIPPLAATLAYFPLWKTLGGRELLSGISVLLLLVCLTPLFKYVSAYLKAPSAKTLWLIIFIAFFSLSRIADEMTVISFIGFISNLFGSFIFKLGEKKNEKL